MLVTRRVVLFKNRLEKPLGEDFRMGVLLSSRRASGLDIV